MTRLTPHTATGRRAASSRVALQKTAFRGERGGTHVGKRTVVSRAIFLAKATLLHDTEARANTARGQQHTQKGRGNERGATDRPE